MLKGIQKKMIMVKTGGSSVFEAAYFVLRSDKTAENTDENAMIREATRILQESELYPRRNTPCSKKLRHRRMLLLFFLAGVLCGGLLLALLWLLT